MRNAAARYGWLNQTTFMDADSSETTASAKDILPRKENRLEMLFILAFKLTSTTSLQEQTASVKSLFNSSHADLVIQNDSSKIDPALNQHEFQLFKKNGLLKKGNTKHELATSIADYLENEIAKEISK